MSARVYVITGGRDYQSASLRGRYPHGPPYIRIVADGRTQVGDSAAGRLVRSSARAYDAS